MKINRPRIPQMKNDIQIYVGEKTSKKKIAGETGVTEMRGDWGGRLHCHGKVRRRFLRESRTRQKKSPFHFLHNKRPRAMWHGAKKKGVRGGGDPFTAAHPFWGFYGRAKKACLGPGCPRTRTKNKGRQNGEAWKESRRTGFRIFMG